MVRLYISGIFGGRNALGMAFRALLTFGMPLTVAILCYRYQWNMGDDLPSISVSAFSIFSAMLFASQVAAFSVFNYKMLEIAPSDSDDDIINEENLTTSRRRESDLRGAFRTINAGISVLTLLAVSLTVVAIAIASEPIPPIERILTAGLTLFASHFLASFTLTCLHVFNLFDSAYLGEET